jgi:hypothetical protein
MWNPVTIASLTAAVVAIGGVVVAIISAARAGTAVAQHVAGHPAAEAAPPLLPTVPETQVRIGINGQPVFTEPDVTGLTGGADPGKPPGVKDS